MTTPEVVDCLGLACPLPLVLLAKAVAGVEVGAQVVLLSDDPGALVDVPVWCRLKDQEFLGREDRPEGGWTFRVRRSK
ncbi:MAG TPA: sulfurtransferase TusA family protein [Actinomycetes bacterium]|jgi:TusA-related sulfurtransferase|nr:sulfurtransferase TusA family protein [Actinomycetes bacterium]